LILILTAKWFRLLTNLNFLAKNQIIDFQDSPKARLNHEIIAASVGNFFVNISILPNTASSYSTPYFTD